MNDIHALSGAYAVDALDDVERAAFEVHLAGCDDCRIEVAELQAAAGLLTEIGPVTPSPSVRSAVLAEIGTVRPLPPRQASALHRRRSRALLVAVAAVIALLVGGIAVTRPWSENTSQTPNASDRVLAAKDATKVSMDLPGGARATVVRSISEGRAVLITRGMSDPPAGKVYQLWLQSRRGTMVPAGLMPQRADQTMLLDGDASTATAAGITIEPAGGSPQPTSTPIVLFDLARS